MATAPAGPRPERPTRIAPAVQAAGLPSALVEFAALIDCGVLTRQEAISLLEQRIAEIENPTADLQGAREQRPPKILPPIRQEITGLRPLTQCSCGRSLLPGMRFCDACGRPLSYTGKTERLDQGNQGPPINYPTEPNSVLFR